MEWIKVNPNESNTIPDENVWVYTLEKEVTFVPKGVYIPFNFCTHYQLLNPPAPPNTK